MKALILGYGSMGQRHAENIRALRPECSVFYADPTGINGAYADWRKAVREHPDSDFAVISSPTDYHLTQMIELAKRGIPFLVEKPCCSESEVDYLAELIDSYPRLPCAVGFQYRFHHRMGKLRMLAERSNSLGFIGQEDLVGKYGRTVGGTMVSHPIDLACYFYGDPVAVEVQSDGVEFTGWLRFRDGKEATFTYDMGTDPRISQVIGKYFKTVDLDADENAYRVEMQEYLRYLRTGEAGPVATLRDGLRVMRILENRAS